MLEARKENKVYKIDETMKDRYLKEGFDIYDENGQIIEHTPLKKIKYSDHLKKMEELKLEKNKEIEELKAKQLNSENVLDLLKKYADDKSIDIGSCTSASGILSKIIEIEKES